MPYKKIFISISFIMIILLSFSQQLKVESSEKLDEAFIRSATTFAVARGLNALISVVQGTELSFVPVGVGVTFTPGEVIDPVNDMVERFSWVMLVSSISLATQKIVLEISNTLFFQLLLLLFLALFLIFYWIKRIENEKLFSWIKKIFIVLLILRFSVPFFLIANETFYTAILSKKFDNAQKTLSLKTEEIEILVQQAQEIKKGEQKTLSNDSWLESIQNSFNKKVDGYNIIKQLDALKSKVDKLLLKFESIIDDLIQLITLFIFSTIIMPLLFLWIIYKSVAYILKVRF